MRKPKTILEADELRPEYDFASMKGGVRGKYLERVRESTNIVLIEPAVAEAFPTERAVNEALKGVLNTREPCGIRVGCLTRRCSRRAAHVAERSREGGLARLAAERHVIGRSFFNLW